MYVENVEMTGHSNADVRKIDFQTSDENVLQCKSVFKVKFYDLAIVNTQKLA